MAWRCRAKTEQSSGRRCQESGNVLTRRAAVLAATMQRLLLVKVGIGRAVCVLSRGRHSFRASVPGQRRYDAAFLGTLIDPSPIR